MKVLAFDTSAAACSAAILGPGGAILAARRRDLARGHAEFLMPMLREVLAAAALDFAALDLLAVTTGPGTFTGIRIGLAAARGLALASGLPLIGVTSFEAVAAAVEPAERAGRALLVAIDSRRADVFVQAFDAAGRLLGEPQAVEPDALAAVAPPGELLVAGDGAASAIERLRAAGRSVLPSRHGGAPEAVHVARLAQARWRPGGPPPAPPRPTYLRAPDVTLPKARPGNLGAAEPGAKS